MAAMMNEEADTKIAAREECRLNSLSNEDDAASLGSSRSIDSWEVHYQELKKLMRIDYPMGGFVPVEKYSPALGNWIFRQRLQHGMKGCGYACPLSDERIQKLEDVGFWWQDEDQGQGTLETGPPLGSVAATQDLEQKEQRPSRKSKEQIRYSEELKSHMNANTGSTATPAFYYFLAVNHSKLELSLSRRDPYFHRLSNFDRNELMAKEAAAWWTKLDQSEMRRYTDIVAQGVEKGSIECKAPRPEAKEQETVKKVIVAWPWETNFERLVKYVKEHGSGYVLPPKSDLYFYNWVCRQRCDHRGGRMPSDRIAKLENIGFLWEKPDEVSEEASCTSKDDASGWQTQEEESHQSSNCNIHSSLGDGKLFGIAGFSEHVNHARGNIHEAPNNFPKQLRTDTSKRDLKRTQSPSVTRPDTKKRKTEIPWETNFARLVKYVEEHGSGFICPPTSDGYFHRWVCRQRGDRKRSKLSSDRISKLESIGFLWEKPDEITGEQSRNSKVDGNLKAITTHARVETKSPEAPRPEAKKGTTKTKVVALPWEANFERLVKYVEKHGSGYIMPPKSDPYFCKWVTRQRSDHNTSRMSADRISKLESIGFLWRKPKETKVKVSCSTEDAWGRQAQDTESHHSFNCGINSLQTSAGSLDTAKHSAAKSSGSGCCTIEEQVSRTGAGPQRCFETINKKQNPDAFPTWEENYERLVKYVENHGTGYICPQTPDEYFNRWVTRQRSDKRLKRMSADRISKLESIGYLWEEPEESRVNELRQTPERESHQSLHFITDSSPDSNESFDSAAPSTTKSSLAETSVIEERHSKPAARPQNKRKSLNSTSTTTRVDDDSEINENLAQLTRCLQKKTERVWKTKYTACKKQIHDLKLQCQDIAKLQAQIQELRDTVEELQRQNEILKKDQAGVGNMKQRYLALQQAHKQEREKRIEAETKLEKVRTSLFSG